MVHSRTERRTGKAGQPLLRGKSGKVGVARGERGIALVVALMMLVLLGVLGAMALYTSSTELRIAGNYRLSQDAFYVAEAAIEYAYADPAIYAAIPRVRTSTNTWPQPGAGDCPDDASYNCLKFLAPLDPAAPSDVQLRVRWETCGDMPVGSGASSEAGEGTQKLVGDYFLVNVRGSLWNNPETRIAIETLHVRPAAACSN